MEKYDIRSRISWQLNDQGYNRFLRRNLQTALADKIADLISDRDRPMVISLDPEELEEREELETVEMHRRLYVENLTKCADCAYFDRDRRTCMEEQHIVFGTPVHEHGFCQWGKEQWSL